jgi:hypothetical protein
MAALVESEQLRVLTRPELLMQAKWIDALKELKKKDPTKFPRTFVIPDIIFENENVYMPDYETLSLQGLSPETYTEFEKIFDTVVIPDFNLYKLTKEYVDIAVSSIWDRKIYPDLPKIVIGNNGNFKIIANEAEILRDINSKIFYEMLYDSVKKILAHYNSPFIENDIIIYVNCHGVMEHMMTKHPLNILDTHDMQVTFISYAKLGDCSFSIWPDMYKFIHKIFDGIEFRGLNIQKILQTLWRNKLYTSKEEKKTGAALAEYGKQYMYQLPDEGWNIYTKCSERTYNADPSFVPPGVYYLAFEVLYDALGLLKGHDIFEELKFGKGIVLRSQLIDFLHKKGYKRPLFIDISCAISDDKRLTHSDLRALRAARRAYLPSSVREGVAGGRKSRRNKKLRKNKRKSKKNIGM